MKIIFENKDGVKTELNLPSLYTAGEGIKIEGNVISCTAVSSITFEEVNE